MTPRQRAVVDVIADFVSLRGRAPSVDEIAGVLDVSHETARRHIVALEEYGVVTRGVTLLDNPRGGGEKSKI
jgi:DeoR/GlpR family transcriptional regulator of sugar metabolism